VTKGFTPAVAPLGALSYKLHKDLAAQHNGREKWGYSRSTGTSLKDYSTAAASGSGADWASDGSSRANVAPTQATKGKGPAWLTHREASSLEIISSNDTVAQVDPKRLCEFLLEQCIERGVKVHQPARVASVSKDARDELAGVRIVKADGTETDSMTMPRLNMQPDANTRQSHARVWLSQQEHGHLRSFLTYSLPPPSKSQSRRSPDIRWSLSRLDGPKSTKREAVTRSLQKTTLAFHLKCSVEVAGRFTSVG
jgi:hypothetical protein